MHSFASAGVLARWRRWQQQRCRRRRLYSVVRPPVDKITVRRRAQYRNTLYIILWYSVSPWLLFHKQPNVSCRCVCVCLAPATRHQQRPHVWPSPKDTENPSTGWMPDALLTPANKRKRSRIYEWLCHEFLSLSIWHKHTSKHKLQTDSISTLFNSEFICTCKTNWFGLCIIQSILYGWIWINYRHVKP